MKDLTKWTKIRSATGSASKTSTDEKAQEKASVTTSSSGSGDKLSDNKADTSPAKIAQL